MLHPPRPRTRVLLAAAAAFALAAGCGGGGGAGGGSSVTVKLIVPPAGSPDPFQNVTRYHVEVSENGSTVFQDDFSTTPITVKNLTPGTNRTVLLQGFDAAGNLVSHGITTPFDFVDGQSLQVPLYFGRGDSFNAIHSAASTRAGATSAMFPDGHVLVAGGISGSTGLSSAEIYDPGTDTTTAIGNMPGGPHAFIPAVMLSSNEVLVAGGAKGTSGATAKADVFTWNGGSSGTWSSGVADMTTARRDATVVRLDATHAVIAGGDSGNGFPLDTTEVFRWTGSAGTWQAGALLQSPRMGPAGMPGPNGRAAICGGWNAGAEGGASSESKTCDILTLSGDTVTSANGTSLRYASGYMGVIPVDATTFLLTGGETDPITFTAQSETVRWMGTTLNNTQRADLPGAHRRGGGVSLGNGNVLVVGGDTGTRPVLAPVDESLLWDSGADSYAATTSTPGPTASATGWPLPDGTFLVVTDGGLFRYVP